MDVRARTTVPQDLTDALINQGGFSPEEVENNPELLAKAMQMNGVGAQGALVPRNEFVVPKKTDGETVAQIIAEVRGDDSYRPALGRAQEALRQFRALGGVDAGVRDVTAGLRSPGASGALSKLDGGRPPSRTLASAFGSRNTIAGAPDDVRAEMMARELPADAAAALQRASILGYHLQYAGKTADGAPMFEVADPDGKSLATLTAKPDEWKADAPALGEMLRQNMDERLGASLADIKAEMGNIKGGAVAPVTPQEVRTWLDGTPMSVALGADADRLFPLPAGAGPDHPAAVARQDLMTMNLPSELIAPMRAAAALGFSFQYDGKTDAGDPQFRFVDRNGAPVELSFDSMQSSDGFYFNNEDWGGDCAWIGRGLSYWVATQAGASPAEIQQRIKSGDVAPIDPAALRELLNDQPAAPRNEIIDRIKGGSTKPVNVDELRSMLNGGN